MAASREEVVVGVSQWTEWWIDRRLEKVKELNQTSMTLNPFLLPLISGLHGFVDFDEAAAFQLGRHLAGGHDTGFGKLVDEKVLLHVFGTSKLTKVYRVENGMTASAFDDIDHLVPHDDAPPDLLSLKASKWTIQLGQAVNLNASFKKLVDLRERGEFPFGRIVLASFNGRTEDLTDKYYLAQGRIRRHDVVDLTDTVDVFAGREFWTWVNEGVSETQDWVLDGILDGIEKAKSELESAADYITRFEGAISSTYTRHIDPDSGQVDWHAILREING